MKYKLHLITIAFVFAFLLSTFAIAHILMFLIENYPKAIPLLFIIPAIYLMYNLAYDYVSDKYKG